MTQGTIGERMAALYKDPSQLYPNTDAGKAEAIAYLQRPAGGDPRRACRTVFNRLPPYRFEVRRVPPQTEAGAAVGLLARPGARRLAARALLLQPARHRRVAEVLACRRTVYHEGMPGHHLQGGLALSEHGPAADPQDRRLLRLWRGLGALRRAAGRRDGHVRRRSAGPARLSASSSCSAPTAASSTPASTPCAGAASRRSATSSTTTARRRGFATREVERYCVTPGQACSYKLGHTVFTGLRDEGQGRAGAEVRHQGLPRRRAGTGRVPLEILQAEGDRWIVAHTA